ncbi:MAG: type I-MYXAN CRISPR-associated protein Cmx8, partial [Myxococcales bacterium]|nr:type I-MYXAN CRISPR-associated protein Cmx8 [Myxococcales bacterium]
MAKPESKKAKAAPEVIELRYTLAELPSSQHRAGLAGLVFMIDWLKRQRPKKVGICEYLDLDARGVSVKIDLPGLIQLFDQVYGASHEEQRSTSPWKGQEPLRIDEDTIEERGKTKTKTKKYYVYPVVVPRGAFLADIRWDQTVDKAGNGPWIKLWRDMVWTIMRGVPAQRRPFNERATASFDKDAHEAWAMLRKPELTVDLPSTYYLGAQATTAENVAFKDRARFQFLLHFWPFVAQIYVPQTIDHDGKSNNHGFAIAVPDVADLALFVEELPEALNGRSETIRGYRPADSLVDLSQEAALALFVQIKQRLAQREGARSATADLVLGVDVFHMAKEGNNVRVLGSGRVDPDETMIDAYQRFHGNYWSPHFRRLYLGNLIAGRPWYQGFDRLCATTAWGQIIGSKYFKHDARGAFEESKMRDNE